MPKASTLPRTAARRRRDAAYFMVSIYGGSRMTRHVIVCRLPKLRSRILVNTNLPRYGMVAVWIGLRTEPKQTHTGYMYYVDLEILVDLTTECDAR